MPPRESTSPWVYVGIGCGGLALVALVIMGAIGLFGYQWVQDVRKGIEDPVERDRRVRELLRADSLPEGYHALASFSTPLLFDLAVLTDRVPDPEGQINGFEQTGFILVQLKPILQEDNDLDDLLEGRTGELDVFEAADFDWGGDRLADSGSFDWQTGHLRWASYAGTFRFDREPFEGLATLFGLTCPDDPDLRLGIWFERAELTEEAQFAGTIADPARLKSFLGHFQLCSIP